MRLINVCINRWPKHVSITIGIIEIKFSFYSSGDLDIFKREIAQLCAEDVEGLKRDVEKLE